MNVLPVPYPGIRVRELNAPVKLTTSTSGMNSIGIISSGRDWIRDIPRQHTDHTIFHDRDETLEEVILMVKACRASFEARQAQLRR